MKSEKPGKINKSKAKKPSKSDFGLKLRVRR